MVRKTQQCIFFKLLLYNENKSIFFSTQRSKWSSWRSLWLFSTQSLIYLSPLHLCLPGIPFMQVEALDRDDRNTAHAELRFSLMEQTPRIPSSQMFFIDSITGEVSLTEEGQSQVFSFGKVNMMLCLFQRGRFFTIPGQIQDLWHKYTHSAIYLNNSRMLSQSRILYMKNYVIEPLVLWSFPILH